MIAGYALVAYPDKWGSSGVMTFIVNQQGRIYQKDLGPTTEETAHAMTEYDPDASWTLVKSRNLQPAGVALDQAPAFARRAPFALAPDTRNAHGAVRSAA